MAEFKFIDLFAGIGGIRIPFDRLGGTCVFSSEWDKSAQLTYEANFGEKPQGDITKIPSTDIPDHDILLGGFPCQAFSIMGNKLGFADTRGTLFFEIERILSEKEPHAFLLENVKQIVSHDKGRTFNVILEKLNSLDYYVHWEILNALDFNLPQKRERTIIVGFKKNYKFKFPEPLNIQPSLDDVLENDSDVDPKLFASQRIIEKRQERLKVEPFYPSIWHENKGGNISVLPYSCALRTGASYSYLLVNGVRRPSSRELLRLQGFPDSYKIVVPHSEIRKQTGNSVAINVIEAVAKEIFKAIKQNILVEEENEVHLRLSDVENKLASSH